MFTFNDRALDEGDIPPTAYYARGDYDYATCDLEVSSTPNAAQRDIFR
jgi:hypothetical protein